MELMTMEMEKGITIGVEKGITLGWQEGQSDLILLKLTWWVRGPGYIDDGAHPRADSGATGGTDGGAVRLCSSG